MYKLWTCSWEKAKLSIHIKQQTKRNGMERNTVHHEMKWTSINVQNDYLHSDSDCNLWFIYIYFNMSDEFFGGAIMMWMWWWWWRHRAHTRWNCIYRFDGIYSTLLHSTVFHDLWMWNSREKFKAFTCQHAPMVHTVPPTKTNTTIPHSNMSHS